MSPRHEPVAVTGVGAVSAFGVGAGFLRRGLLDSTGALGPLERFNSGLAAPPTVGEVRACPDLPARGSFHPSRTDRLAVIAAREAAECAGLDAASLRAAGAVLATTVGGLCEISPAISVAPGDYYRGGGLDAAGSYPPYHVGDAVAHWLDLGGPRFTVTVACSSGSVAIALAADMVLDGEAPLMLAGGSDALSQFTISGFNSLQALDPEPCRPFDSTRGGLNIGEGSAVLVLEPLRRARERGAPVLALLAGWAFNNDAYHLTAPDPAGRGLAACIVDALGDAGLSVDDAGYVNAHGTGTPLNDVAEAAAYDAAFAGRRVRMPVSSTKSHFGHCLGAAGALEAAATIFALESGVLYPTLRLERPIEARSVDWLAGGQRRFDARTALSVSAGFGGSNAALVFSRPE